MDDSFLQQSTPSATKHLFILAKIHLLFNLKLLYRSRSLSSILNTQSAHGPGTQSHPTQLPFPSAAWGCSDPFATAISTVSLLVFSFLPWDVQSSPTAWPFLSNFSIFSYLKKNKWSISTYLPGTPRSIFHTTDDTRQFLHSLPFPQPLSVSSAPR